MNLKSLCWMSENASRGLPSSRVAPHISICLRYPQGVQRKRVMASPYFRLHEMFWYLLISTKWISGDNRANVNDHIEMLEQLSIFGNAIFCTSPR